MGLIVENYDMHRYGITCDAYISVGNNTIVLQKDPQTGIFFFQFIYYIWYSKDSRVGGGKPLENSNVVFNIPQTDLTANAYDLAYRHLKTIFPTALDD